jgi:hypothetical protein
MKLFFEGSKIQAVLNQTNKPAMLKAREVQEWEDFANECGIRTISGADNVVHVDISGTTPQALIRFLTEAEIACVSIDPQDLKVLAPGFESKLISSSVAKRPTTLKDAQARDAMAASLTAIPINQIFDTVRQLIWSVIPEQPVQVSKEEADRAVAQMRKAGMLVGDGDLDKGQFGSRFSPEVLCRSLQGQAGRSSRLSTAK